MQDFWVTVIYGYHARHTFPHVTFVRFNHLYSRVHLSSTSHCRLVVALTFNVPFLYRICVVKKVTAFCFVTLKSQPPCTTRHVIVSMRFTPPLWHMIYAPGHLRNDTMCSCHTVHKMRAALSSHKSASAITPGAALWIGVDLCFRKID